MQLRSFIEKHGVTAWLRNQLGFADHEIKLDSAASTPDEAALHRQRAEHALCLALEFAPGNSNILEKLVRVYVDSGSWDLAIDHAKELLKVRGKDAYVYFNLAIAQIKTGQMEEAYQTLDIVVKNYSTIGRERHLDGALGLQRQIVRTGIHAEDFLRALNEASEKHLLPPARIQALMPDSETTPLSPEILATFTTQGLKRDCGMVLNGAGRGR